MPVNTSLPNEKCGQIVRKRVQIVHHSHLKPKSKRETEYPPLPFEEWDFRMIEEDLETLQAATEYEYLRSSNLRQDIEDWLDSDLSEVVEGYHMTVQAGDDSMAVAQSAFMESQNARRDLFEKVKGDKCTVREYIHRAFEICEGAEIFEALNILSNSLPQPILAARVENLVLRYDLFPQPWLNLPEGYARSRSDAAIRGESPPPSRTLEEFEPLIEIPLIEILARKRIKSKGIVVFLDRSLRTVCFRFDFRRGTDPVEAAFKKWLTKNFQERAPGRKNPEGWLLRLAAFRLSLVDGLTARQAMDYAERRKKEKPGATWDTLSISTESNWSRAVSSAKADLKKDFIKKIHKSFITAKIK